MLPVGMLVRPQAVMRVASLQTAVTLVEPRAAMRLAERLVGLQMMPPEELRAAMLPEAPRAAMLPEARQVMPLVGRLAVMRAARLAATLAERRAVMPVEPQPAAMLAEQPMERLLAVPPPEAPQVVMLAPQVMLVVAPLAVMPEERLVETPVVEPQAGTPAAAD